MKNNTAIKSLEREAMQLKLLRNFIVSTTQSQVIINIYQKGAKK